MAEYFFLAALLFTGVVRAVECDPSTLIDDSPDVVENRLLSEALNRDEAATSELVSRTYSRLVGALKKRGATEAEAEDAVASTFLSLYESGGQFHGKSAFFFLLDRARSHSSRSYRKERSREIPLVDSSDEKPQGVVIDTLAGSERTALEQNIDEEEIKALIDLLPEPQRKLVQAHAGSPSESHAVYAKLGMTEAEAEVIRKQAYANLLVLKQIDEEERPQVVDRWTNASFFRRGARDSVGFDKNTKPHHDLLPQLAELLSEQVGPEASQFRRSLTELNSSRRKIVRLIDFKRWSFQRASKVTGISQDRLKKLYRLAWEDLNVYRYGSDLTQKDIETKKSLLKLVRVLRRLREKKLNESSGAGPSFLDDFTALSAAAARLDPELREVIEKLYFEGNSVEEAAKTIGLSTRYVEHRRAKAIRYLLPLLEDPSAVEKIRLLHLQSRLFKGDKSRARRLASESAILQQPNLLKDPTLTRNARVLKKALEETTSESQQILKWLEIERLPIKAVMKKLGLTKTSIVERKRKAIQEFRLNLQEPSGVEKTHLLTLFHEVTGQQSVIPREALYASALPIRDLAAQEKIAKVQSAISRLPPDAARVIQVMDLHRLPPGKAAEALGAKPRTLNSQHRKALALLASLIKVPDLAERFQWLSLYGRARKETIGNYSDFIADPAPLLELQNQKKVDLAKRAFETLSERDREILSRSEFQKESVAAAVKRTGFSEWDIRKNIAETLGRFDAALGAPN